MSRRVKITRIETIPVRVPIKPMLAIKSGRGGSHVTSPFLIVKIHTDEGLIGLGEASCTPRWSGEDQFTAQHLIKTYFEPLLVGRDPLDRVATKEWTPAVAGNPFTKSSIEMALWDIRGKAAGKPLYDLFGGTRIRDFVPTKWSVSGRQPAEAAAIARWAVAQGFTKMKVKVGTGHEADVRRVRAVRDAVGPSIALGVDANGGWDSVFEAQSIIRHLRDYDIAFVEQPLAAGDIFGMAEVRTTAGVPVIADESVYTVQDAKNLSRIQAADVFSIYVGKSGGIFEALGIAAVARLNGLKATIGSNLELGIGSAAMAHLALAADSVTAEQFPCDIIGPLFYEDDILRDPLPIKGGEARVHEGRPGLGVELDDAKVEKYRVG
jgi:muconate cycloisomerase